jgi:type III secretion protein L
MGVVVLIDRPGYRLAADRKVLKSSEAAVIAETAQAYVLARERINSALRDLDQVCKRATDDAHRDGLAKAQQEALKRWTLNEVDRLSLLKSMQPALAEIVFDAVALLARGIDREAFMARALEVLRAALRDASWAQLRVHPAAVPAMEAALAEFRRDTGLGRLARIVPDEALHEDGCVLESELGRIDASLSTQLQAIRAAISEAARRACGDTDECAS